MIKIILLIKWITLTARILTALTFVFIAVGVTYLSGLSILYRKVTGNEIGDYIMAMGDRISGATDNKIR